MISHGRIQSGVGAQVCLRPRATPVQARGTGRAWAEEGVGVVGEQQRGRGRDSQGHCAASSFQRCFPALPEPGTSRPVGQALFLLQQVRTLRVGFAALLEIS